MRLCDVRLLQAAALVACWWYGSAEWTVLLCATFSSKILEDAFGWRIFSTGLHIPLVYSGTVAGALHLLGLLWILPFPFMVATVCMKLMFTRISLLIDRISNLVPTGPIYVLQECLKKVLPVEEEGFAVDLASSTGYYPAQLSRDWPRLTWICTDILSVQPLLGESLEILAVDRCADFRVVDVSDRSWDALKDVAGKCSLVTCSNLLVMRDVPGPCVPDAFLWKDVMRGASELLRPNGVLFLFDSTKHGNFGDLTTMAAFGRSLNLTLISSSEWGEHHGGGLMVAVLFRRK